MARVPPDAISSAVRGASPRRLALCAFSIALLAAQSALGAPSIWERARDSKSIRVARVLSRLERVLDGVSQAERDPDMMQDFRLGTLAVAELSGARALDDPRLLLLLSEAMVGADLGREEEAKALLGQALVSVPPGQPWLEADIRALLALAERKDPKRATVNIGRALPMVWQRDVRSLLFRQRADAKMALADVRGSAADARAALEAADDDVGRSLSRFALAIALERSGDLPSALVQARLARLSAPRLANGEIGVLDLPGIFVFRPADADYAAALSAMASAEAAREPRVAVAEYQRAVSEWFTYLNAAADDRWAAAARSHAAACQKRLNAVLQRAPVAEPPSP